LFAKLRLQPPAAAAPPGLGDDRPEGVALVHRDVGQHLAVEIDARELQAVHELAVGEPFGANAALMRWIHSARKLRFFTLRSR
jgi:hypothetical protein